MNSPELPWKTQSCASIKFGQGIVVEMGSVADQFGAHFFMVQIEAYIRRIQWSEVKAKKCELSLIIDILLVGWKKIRDY